MSDMVSTIIIAAVGIIIPFVTAFLMEKYADRKRLKEIQDEINRINKEYISAAKRKDEKRIAELDKESDKLGALSKESLMLSFKSMAIAIPIFFIALWIVKYVFPTFEITLPFSLPVPFRSSNLIDMRNVFGPQGWLIITVFIGGILQFAVTSIKSAIEKKKSKQARANKAK